VLMFEWNALQKGDRVLAHDPRNAALTLRTGVVAQVDAQRRGNAPNHVGVKIVGDTTVEIVWPTRLAVHRDPLDPRESCWRCQAIAFRTRQRVEVEP
jgi:hypothetical protein